MNQRCLRWILLMGLVPVVAHKAAAVEVASVFGSKMVLQRDVSVPVWGRAEPGEQVTVTFADQKRTVKADDLGRWMVRLDAMRGGDKAHDLIVHGGGEPVTFEDVCVGEVWLVLSHGITPQYGDVGPAPNEMNRVRSFGGGGAGHNPVPLESFGRNSTWGPGYRLSGFDVLTIPFANRIGEAENLPVGIVRVDVGDLDATIPVEGFAAVAELADVARRAETWNPQTPKGKKAYVQWRREYQQWRETIGRKIDRNESIQPGQPPLLPSPELGDPTQPTVVFNRQLNPLARFALRGVLHIHEDAIDKNPPSTVDSRYADKMRALIAGLRKAFGQPNLAFAYTQRGQPGMRHVHTAGGKENQDILNFNAWHGHRDRQRRVLPYARTGMVVTLDVENDPGTVGGRFADWALAEIYGKGGVASGPLYASHRIEGNRVVVEFDHVGRGLMTAGYPEFGRPLVEQDHGHVRGFAVAGEDRIFRSAQARIDGKTVVVHSDAVQEPVAVRYASGFDPRGMNLYNREGLPAPPFHTDDWPIADLEETVEQYKAKPPEQLIAMFGCPTMLHSHAAAKALAGKGEAVALPLIESLLASPDPDRRCGGLRTLGYLYWMGEVPRKYYGEPPQPVTPAIARAIDWIGHAAEDSDPHVRRCAVEALSLIGSENEDVFTIALRRVVDSDPLVRTAVLRLSKYRFHKYKHNTALAYTLLRHKPFGDRTSLNLATVIIDHSRIDGPVDFKALASFMSKIGPAQGGPYLYNLGSTLRRVRISDIHNDKAFGHPSIFPQVLHLYALGARNYCLYTTWHWFPYENHLPTLRGKVEQLRQDIERLKRERPVDWQDLSRRYADAIVGLQDVIEDAEAKLAKKENMESK